MKKLLLVLGLAALSFSVADARPYRTYHGYKKPVRVHHMRKAKVHKSQHARRVALRKAKARKMRLHHPRRYR